MRRPSAAQAKQLAQGIERQLSELGKKEEAERERFVRASVSVGAMAAALDQWGADSKKKRDALAMALAEFERLSEEHRKVSAPFVLKSALLARELHRYKETGELYLDDSDVEEIKGALFHTRPSAPHASWLPLDLRELGRYLKRWWTPGRQELARDLGPREGLPSGSPLPTRPAPVLAGPRVVRDAGRGRSEIDPVPELIEQLLSAQPRERALAADAVGARGAAALPAVPALRRALRDADARVRASAVLSLGAVGGGVPGVVEDVRRALLDRDEDVRLSARTALLQLERAR